MHLSETASDVIHHRYAVVINRKHIIFHKVVYNHPAGEVGNSAAVLLQIYFSICVQKNYQNTMRFDKVTAKIEGCNFFASQCTRPYLQCRKILFWYKLSWRFFFDEKIGLGPSHNSSRVEGHVRLKWGRPRSTIDIQKEIKAKANTKETKCCQTVPLTTTIVPATYML